MISVHSGNILQYKLICVNYSRILLIPIADNHYEIGVPQ